MAGPTFSRGDVLTAANLNAMPRGVMAATSGGTSGYAYDYGTAGGAIPTSTGAVVGISDIDFTSVANRMYIAHFTADYRDDAGGTSGTQIFFRFDIDGAQTGWFVTSTFATDQGYGSTSVEWPFVAASATTYTIGCEWFATTATTQGGTPLVWITDVGPTA